MKPNESIENFFDRFLHLCYESMGEDTNWDLFKKKFKHLVHIFLHDESEPHDVSTSPNFVNHEAPLILEEELANPFVPCPPPFSVLMWVTPFDDNKVGISIKFLIHLLILLPHFINQIQWRKFQNGS